MDQVVGMVPIPSQITGKSSKPRKLLNDFAPYIVQRADPAGNQSYSAAYRQGEDMHQKTSGLMKSFEGAASTSKSYQAFAAPEDILVDGELAGEERRRLLDAWRFELELSPESPDARGNPEELLRRLNACRRLLSEEED